MHILILPSWYPAHHDDFHGTFFRDQALALLHRGHSVGVIAPMVHSIRKIHARRLPQKTSCKECDEGIVTYRRHFWADLPRFPYGNYLLWKRAADQLVEQYIAEQGYPDVIHAHSAHFGGVVAAQWKKRYGFPIVLTEHKSSLVRRELTKCELYLVKKAAHAADCRIAVSPKFAELLAKKLNFEINVWIWLPNIVSERFQYRGKSKGVNAQRSNRIVILNLGKMKYIKGQLELLEAFGKSFANDPRVKLWLGSNGPLKQQLKENVTTNGLDNQVRFLGDIPPKDVPGIMQEVDAVVISSHFETFGLVAAEALMCGKPVVATRCGGPEWIVQEGDGLLVPPKAPNQLAEALVRMVYMLPTFNPETIADRAKLRFSPDEVCKQLEDIYKDVIKGNV